MLTILGLLASGAMAAHGPAHYVVDVTATQESRFVATSHLLTQAGRPCRFVQDDNGQRLSVTVTPRADEDGAIKLEVAVEMSSDDGTVTRKASMDPVLGSDHYFAVDVPAEAGQPAGHFDITVQEDAPGRS